LFAVIFRAKVALLDDQYSIMASEMRDLAIEKYGCLEFVATTEGEDEIAISYWPDEDSISRWKSDTKHIKAQKLGQSKWYKSYTVEVVELKRKYSSN